MLTCAAQGGSALGSQLRHGSDEPGDGQHSIRWRERRVTATKLISVPAAYAGEGQGAGPLFVSQRAGLFEAEGLDVQIRLLDGAKRVVRGLLEGEVLFGNLAAPALVGAFLDGAVLVYLTGGINQQFLVGRPGMTS